MNIGDQISTISYISAIELFKKDDTVFEKLDLVQLGIKNLDLEDIEELPIPKKMFGKSPKKPKEYEKMCLEECDQLMGKNQHKSSVLIQLQKFSSFDSVAQKLSLRFRHKCTKIFMHLFLEKICLT